MTKNGESPPTNPYSQSARSRSVESSCVGVAMDTSPTQLNGELSCVAINGPLELHAENDCGGRCEGATANAFKLTVVAYRCMVGAVCRKTSIC